MVVSTLVVVIFPSSLTTDDGQSINATPTRKKNIIKITKIPIKIVLKVFKQRPTFK